MAILKNTPTIITQRLILRKFTIDDVDEFLCIMSESEVNTFLPWFPLKTYIEAETYLKNNYFQYYQKPIAYRYAICNKETNLPIGYIGLGEGESFDLGYALKKEFWHKGIMTEAARAVVAQIKKSPYRFITATHDVNNPYSGEVMKKIGMTYKYSYRELWYPKNIMVTFRMYQLNFDGNIDFTYWEYWNRHEHFIEENIL